MNIEHRYIPIRDIVEGYKDSDEEGVVGYGGELNIRPKFQREFIYKDKQQLAVINTIMHGWPLNTMYWMKAENVGYELLDGQQRTLSIAKYHNSDFSYDGMYFHNLPKDKQEEFLNYKLHIYVCDGTDSERLEWFNVINTAGEKLSEQEIRNAVYAGEWLTDAKRYFSKKQCVAWRKGKDYLKGTPIRQDYLETLLRWISDSHIEDYMAKHQHDENASTEWAYFQKVIDWTQATFPTYRNEMKGVEWGDLYEHHKDDTLNPDDLEKRIKELMEDDDVTKKNGIYSYVLNGEERSLSIRSFSPAMKREAYERQKGICPSCGEHFELESMQADHITPWSEGGRTIAENCQMLCAGCNRRKSNK